MSMLYKYSIYRKKEDWLYVVYSRKGFFFELQSVDRGIRECEPIPTIYLSIRNAETGKMVGQMRFNRDPVYSEENIRMAFNMMDTSFIDPETLEGGSRLEELVVGGIWLSKLKINRRRIISSAVCHIHRNISLTKLFFINIIIKKQKKRRKVKWI